MGSITTSSEAYDFAQLVIQDFKTRRSKSKGIKNEEAQEETTPSTSKKMKKDTLPRRIGDIDYGKWEAFAETMEKKELLEKQKKAEEDADYRRVLGGCAHDHSRERQIFEKPTDEKLLAAERFRKEGNTAYQQKNYGLAAVYYRKALLQFDYTFPQTPEEEEWFTREKLASHLNMAACKLKQKEWEETLIQCRLALELDPQNCKALYRRGLVHLTLDNFEEAREALEEAERCSKTKDPIITDALQQLSKKHWSYFVNRQKVYSAMFPALSKHKKLKSSETQSNTLEDRDSSTSGDAQKFPRYISAPPDEKEQNTSTIPSNPPVEPGDVVPPARVVNSLEQPPAERPPAPTSSTELESNSTSSLHKGEAAALRSAFERSESLGSCGTDNHFDGPPNCVKYGKVSDMSVATSETGVLDIPRTYRVKHRTHPSTVDSLGSLSASSPARSQKTQGGVLRIKRRLKHVARPHLTQSAAKVNNPSGLSLHPTRSLNVLCVAIIGLGVTLQVFLLMGLHLGLFLGNRSHVRAVNNPFLITPQGDNRNGSFVKYPTGAHFDSHHIAVSLLENLPYMFTHMVGPYLDWVSSIVFFVSSIIVMLLLLLAIMLFLEFLPVLPSQLNENLSIRY